MSNVIDERVLEMRFDNRQFESGVSQTLSSLDDLKRSLNMSGASRGLEEVNSAVKSCNMSGLGEAVESVRVKFSALQVMGVTALTRITNAAMTAGKRIVSSLTIDPVKTGFQEYETQINAVQTILANTSSKGKTITDVNKALDELNLYADKTIYNFTEMTRNIGTFTAAGVDLDTSVSAIKGIANLAAVSGSTSQQASTAMYQLSQALASGTVKLMDWNSVVNAGMGGQVFQDALKETARVHGIAIDDIINKEGSFRESLSTGWLSADILTETLSKFTGDLTAEQLKQMGYTDKQIEGILKMGKTANDAATKVKTFSQLFDTMKEAAQSGWSQSWEIIVGDFEEAKAFLTEVSDVFGAIIGSSAEARNKVLQEWKDLGGRTDLIQSLKNAFEGIKSVVVPVKEAFSEIFPPITGQQLANFTKTLKELTAKLKLSDTASNNLKRTFKGLFAVIDIVRQLFVAVFKAVTSMFGGVDSLAGGILSVTASFGDWLVKLNSVIKKSDIFNKAFQGIGATIKVVVGIVKEFISFIGEKFVCPGLDFLSTLLGKIGDRFSGVSDAANQMKNDVVASASAMGSSIENSGVYKFLTGVWNIIKSIGKGIGNILGSAFNGIIDAVANADFEDILNFIQALVTGGIGVSIMKFIESLTAPFELIGDVAEGITGTLDAVRDCLSAYQSQLQANALIKLATAIGILAASILVISFVDSDKLGGSLAAITTMFAELAVIMWFFNKIGGGAFKANKNMFTPLITISVAVLILATALKKVGELDMNQVLGGLIGITGCVALLVGTQILLNKFSSGAVKGMMQLIIFAIAVKVMASTIVDLGYLSFGAILKGLYGVLGCVALLVAVSYVMGKFDSSGVKGAFQLIIFATAVKIMGSTLIDISYLKFGEILRGLHGLLGCAAIMVGMSYVLSKIGPSSIKSALQMILMASALKIVASALRDIGAMDFGSILRGLYGMAGALAAMTIALKFIPTGMISKGIGLIAVAAAMKIYASAAKDMGSISWDGIARGLVLMATSLAAITVALRLMPADMITKSIGLVAVSAALVIMSSALESMGGMSWGSVAKGLVTLAGSMTILAIALNAMKGTLLGSAALVVAVAALALLVPVLTSLGSMSWGSIAASLLVLAGAFTIIGVAAHVLAPAIPAILGLAGAIALLGIGVFAIGSGIAAFGAGLVSLAAGFTAVASSMSVMCVGLISTINAMVVGICEGIANGIVAFCKILSEGMPAIADALRGIVQMVCKVLLESAMPIVETVLVLLVKLMQALVEHVPVIVDLLFQFIVQILDSLAKHIPTFIQKAVEILMSIFTGVVKALASVDKGSLMEGLIGVGLIAGVIAALAAIVPLIPAAMVGALGMAAVVAELSLVFAAIGALAQLPGLDWLISEGGDFLAILGTAIGQFVGGIAGGIAKGFTSSLPDIADDLSEFMENLEPFIDGATRMNSSVLEGVKSLAGIIIALTGAHIVDGMTAWFTGGSSLTKFGEDLAEFGPNLKTYSESVVGVDPATVKASVDATKTLCELANTLPKSGGLIGFLSGKSSLSGFGEGLEDLGRGLKGFSTETEGIVPENIIAASKAAKALAEMTSVIPNTGGIAAWFSGENSISNFSGDLKTLGKGLKNFSTEIEGVVPENIIAASNAAKALAEMTKVIPNSGGVGAWFSGDNSISKFGKELPKLGKGLKGFSTATEGIVPENIIAASNAAKALAEMANVIPNAGGIAAWFVGDNSITRFARELPILGLGLKGFSNSLTGIVPENIIAASNAAKSIADLANVIPNEGGIIAWFSGDSGLVRFATQLPVLGAGLKLFSVATEGVVSENVIAAANAAKALAEMANVIPNEGGIIAWFSGDNGIAKFSSQLPILGAGLRMFSTSVDGISAENVTAAATAAKGLADLVSVIPSEGGIVAWFTGETSITKFAAQLPILGLGLKGFSDSVTGIVPENITAAANGAKALAEMTAVIPKEGGIQAWFSGETSISNFADKLPTLGAGLKGFSDSVTGIVPENVTAAASAAKSLGEMTDIIPKNTDKIIKFGENIGKFGDKLKAYFTSMSEVSGDSIASAEKALDSVKEISEIDSGNIKSVSNALKDLTKSVKNMAKDIKSDLKDVGKEAIEAFIKGIKDNLSSAEEAAKSIITKSAEAASSKSSSFETAGKSVVEGFAKGISANTYLAEAKAKAMAQKAYEAAKKELDINSPSKKFIPLGEGSVEGYVKGVDRSMGDVDKSMSEMADTATSGFTNALLSVYDMIENGIDAQPTIRPVLDLSDVEAGARGISGMFGDSSMGLLSNTAAITSMMARRNQNGANDDVVSELTKLRKELGEKEFNNYSIGNVNYSNDEEVANAIAVLLRAYKIGGRT